MKILGLDVGSSSVKVGVVRHGRVVGTTGRASYPTHYDGPKVEVDPKDVLRATASAIRQLGPAAKNVEAIALSVMSPAWLAMDAKGKPLTRLVTHQDRRSVEIAKQIEARVGKARHLAIAGNRPFPGGISSTTLAWFLRNEPAVMKRADLVGHLNTLFHRVLTGARVIDPSNASFTGLYETVTKRGWSEELCEAVGVSRDLLPDILDADAVGGTVTRDAARTFGLRQGTPVLAGMVDTSSAMLLTGAKVGQLMNVMGSTDVLGLSADHAVPHERLLTRALGVGDRWMSVSTIAAAGSALNWAQRTLFPDLSNDDYHRLLSTLARKNRGTSGGVRFEPYLAGERTSIEQKQAAFTGLTLATTREQMLAAVIEALAEASAARLPLLRQGDAKMLHRVCLSGGAAKGLGRIFHRDWPGRWTFWTEDEATLRGLSRLSPRL